VAEPPPCAIVPDENFARRPGLAAKSPVVGGAPRPVANRPPPGIWSRNARARTARRRESRRRRPPRALDGRARPPRSWRAAVVPFHHGWRVERALRDPTRRRAHGAPPAAREGAGGPEREHAARVPGARGAPRHGRPACPRARGVRRSVGPRRVLLSHGVRRRLVLHVD